MGIELQQYSDGTASFIDDTTSTKQATFTNTGAMKLNGNVMPASISFSAAAGTANQSLITITVKDGGGTAIANPFVLYIWLSDAATGAGLTAVTASGAVGVNTGGGADFGTLTSKKSLVSQTLATGVYTLSITDTGKTGFYVCAQLIGSGTAQVSSQLVAGNYG